MLFYNQLSFLRVNRRQEMLFPCIREYLYKLIVACIILGIVLQVKIYAQESVFPGKEWEVRTPESQGVDSEKLDEALKILENMSGSDGIKEVVVIRNGYIIWEGSRIDSLHNLASITKAFTSTCLGLLVDKGECTLDDFAADYEPRLRGGYPEYEKITLRQFATMTSGYDGEGGTYWFDDPEDGSKTPFNPAKPVFAPGTKFSYWDDAVCMSGLVLTKIAKEPLYQLFKENIADPIGMNPDSWNWEDFGKIDGILVNRADGEMNMTPRELARLGLLFLNKGNWAGKQLISRKWVEESTKVQVPSTMEGREDTQRQKSISKEGVGCYGFHWFANGILSNGKRILPDVPLRTFWRSGYPRQRLFIIPEWNMVIVRTGTDNNKEDRPINASLCWNTTLKKIGESIIDNNPTIKGEKKVWQTVTIDFKGPQASEFDSDLNPFIDYRLQTIFIGPGGQTYNVPGFFDGDGQGDRTGCTWKVKFTPDEVGAWLYKASMRKGKNIAVSLDPFAGEAVNLNNASGSFEIDSVDVRAGGFLSNGRLVYKKGEFYLKTLGDGKYWIKGGTDGPENFLGYNGFVNTTPNPDSPKFFHDFSKHVKDWKEGDPDWGNGKGKGIIGALNYLSMQNVNSIYVLFMNIGGDGQDVWPYSGAIDRKGNPRNDNLHFDIAKLQQWEIVFAHAQQKGINLHLVLGEGEEANKKELDEGELGIERKLYYREMIARFSHHNAIQWNICEEYDIPPFPLKPERIKEFAGYINAVDPYKHPVTVHNWKTDSFFEPFIIDNAFSMTSLQFYPGIKQVYPHEQLKFLGFGDKTEIMRAVGERVGHIIPVSIDEFNQVIFKDDMSYMSKGWPFLSGQSFLRKAVTWPVYLSGGAGIEFISENDLKLNDFSLYEKTWKYTWYARNFVETYLPFWEMEPEDGLLTYETSGYYEDGQVFAKDGEVYAVYLPDGNNTGSLDLQKLKEKDMFLMRWYNPRTGEFEGKTKTIAGGKNVILGSPPAEPRQDWIVLIQKIH